MHKATAMKPHFSKLANINDMGTAAHKTLGDYIDHAQSEAQQYIRHVQEVTLVGLTKYVRSQVGYMPPYVYRQVCVMLLGMLRRGR